MGLSFGLSDYLSRGDLNLNSKSIVEAVDFSSFQLKLEYSKKCLYSKSTLHHEVTPAFSLDERVGDCNGERLRVCVQVFESTTDESVARNEGTQSKLVLRGIVV